MAKIKPSMTISQAFKLGELEFASNLIQAPLAGISCWAMRRLAWQFGGLAYTCTEMLSSHQLAKELDRSPRYYQLAVDEGPVCFQLSGDKPDLLAQATVKAQEYGAAIIDFNVGCPKHKIRKKGYGSKLLAESKKLQSLLLAMRRETSCPLTVKIRVDNQHDDNNHMVLDAIAGSGVAGVIIHGRNWRDDYEVAIAYEEIKFFKDNLDITVIANGDVRDADSARELLSKTNADAVMIGRAAIGRPWIFKKISDGLFNNREFTISLQQQRELFLRHLQDLIQIEGEHLACLQARRLAKHYFIDFGFSTDEISLLQNFSTYIEFASFLLSRI